MNHLDSFFLSLEKYPGIRNESYCHKYNKNVLWAVLEPGWKIKTSL